MKGKHIIKSDKDLEYYITAMVNKYIKVNGKWINIMDMEFCITIQAKFKIIT